MSRESEKKNRQPVDQPFSPDDKQQMKNERAMRAQKKPKLDSDSGGGVQPSLSEQALSEQEQASDASNKLAQNALLGPVYASCGGGGGGGGDGRQSLSDDKTAEDVAMAAEAVAQPDFENTDKMQVDLASAVELAF